MSEAQQIASGNHDERTRWWGSELLRRENAMLERQVSVLREALATRVLLDGPTVIRQGPVLDAIDRLERENAALREENRKAHDMACEDAVERYRLNGDNAALKIERNRYRIALEDIAQASVEWAGDRARRELDREDKS